MGVEACRHARLRARSVTTVRFVSCRRSRREGARLLGTRGHRQAGTAPGSAPALTGGLQRGSTASPAPRYGCRQTTGPAPELDELARLIRSEIDKWHHVIEASHIAKR
jgi:hypothetical protein